MAITSASMFGRSRGRLLVEVLGRILILIPLVCQLQDKCLRGTCCGGLWTNIRQLTRATGFGIARWNRPVYPLLPPICFSLNFNIVFCARNSQLLPVQAGIIGHEVIECS